MRLPWNYWGWEITCTGPVFVVVHLGVFHLAWDAERGRPWRGFSVNWNRD